MQVMDWEENGDDGNVTLDITSIVVNVSTLAEFTTLTGFRKGSYVFYHHTNIRDEIGVLVMPHIF